MGTRVPYEIRTDWTGVPAHYWRIGVLDALKAVSKNHDISADLPRWAAQETRDRALRAQWVKENS